jgi:predicted phosphoribosyltransferase
MAPPAEVCGRRAHTSPSTPLILSSAVASSKAWDLVKAVADEVVCPIVSQHYPFAVAGFYRNWYDLTDEEVIRDLEGFTKDYRGREDD